MKLMFTPTPMSTLASAYASTVVLPAVHVHAVKPAVASPRAAHLIQPTRAQSQATALPVAWTVTTAEQHLTDTTSTTGTSTTGNDMKFGGIRGIPPRGKPV